MQRGIVSLTRPEINLIINFLDPVQYQGKPLLNKLIAGASGDKDPVLLELSEEEVETMLDLISFPQDGEKDLAFQTRNKLVEGLDKMRP